MEGVRLTPLATAAAPDDTEREHRLVFREEPRPEPAGPPQPWFVCGAPRAARDLAEALRAAGAPVVPAAEDPDAWAGQLASDGEIAAVAFAAPDARDGLAEQRSALAALPALVRACAWRAAPPRLALVTTAAQAVRAADRPDPGAALFWGFTRVLRREQAELRPLVVDVEPGAPAAARCAAELLAGDDEEQVVLRGDRRFVGRLVRGAADHDAGPVAPWRDSGQPFRLDSARPGRWDALEYRPLHPARPRPRRDRHRPSPPPRSTSSTS